MKDKGCYYLVDTTQGSRDWHYMRKGRITASRIGQIVGHSPFNDKSPEDLAKCIKGELKEEFTPEARKRMDLGNEYEPKVRNMLAKKLNVKINETGFAIWKKDMRFGASLDGIIDDDTGIEIKCPVKMYGPINEYIKKKDFNSGKVDHIWKSQYDQVIANGVITGRKNMIFCVYAIDEKNMFYENVKVDYDYWNNFLYPECCKFYDTYMKNEN